MAHPLLVLVSGVIGRVGGQKGLGTGGRIRSYATSGGEDCKILDEENLVLVLMMKGRKDSHVAGQGSDRGWKKKKYDGESEEVEGVGVNESVTENVSFGTEKRTTKECGKGEGGENCATGSVLLLRGSRLLAGVEVLRKSSEDRRHDRDAAVAEDGAEDGASPEQPQRR